MRRRHQPAGLRIDPVACDGVGICAHLAPDLITVDSWGYPIVDSRPHQGPLRRQARSAVAACPRRALFLQDVEQTGAGHRPEG